MGVQLRGRNEVRPIDREEVQSFSWFQVDKQMTKDTKDTSYFD